MFEAVNARLRLEYHCADPLACTLINKGIIYVRDL